MSYLDIIKSFEEGISGERELLRDAPPDRPTHCEKSEVSEKSPVNRAKPTQCEPQPAKGLAIPCRYDWIPGYRPWRLRCVVHRHSADGNVVFRRNSGGYDTLADMLQAGVLTGEALEDGRRAN